LIVYSATKREFLGDVFKNNIVDILVKSLNDKRIPGVSPSQVKAYENSLRYMDTVLHDGAIPDDSGIAIEFVIPSSAKRVDFIITGKDTANASSVVLVELKQWQSAELTNKDAVVKTLVGGGVREVEHPSYQAWSYAALLEDFNESVRHSSIGLNPCAYLHNYEPDNVITNAFYSEHIEKAPLFLKHDADKLADFIKKFIKKGDSGEALYLIENGRIRPSKSLADALGSMMAGNKEFVMIDDQKLVYETALDMLNKKPKQVLIVEGGPGTGKSVVAVNLLVEATKRGHVSQYVTKNSAPRTVYESKLTGQMKKSRFTSLFKGSGTYTDCSSNVIDMLLVDEAHRLNEKSGMFQNMGENQIKEIITAAKHSVFFLDEDQKVTFKDIGEKEEILKWAKKLKAEVQVMELSSQFRCNGSNGYLAWLDNTLQKRDTANNMLETNEYDFKVFDSPNELRDKMFELNRVNNKARIVAGYCWEWESKKDKNAMDIVIPEHKFKMKWNLGDYGNLWIVEPKAVNEVGCIHTCQGLELDYIGVIIGPDMIVRNGKVITNPSERASSDSSVKGYKKMLEKDKAAANKLADDIIKNTYKTLMTRGIKGCYIYCTDKETAEHFKSRLVESMSKAAVKVTAEEIFDKYLHYILPEHRVEPAAMYKDYLPVYTLKAACGYFGDGNEAEKIGWLKPDIGKKLDRNMFITRVTGKSMEPLIHDGDYCVFRANVVGTRQGKVVLVQHNDISDPETGGKYTVKRYSSTKVSKDDGSWEHEAITLSPENNNFEPIVISAEKAEGMQVIAELITVI